MYYLKHWCQFCIYDTLYVQLEVRVERQILYDKAECYICHKTLTNSCTCIFHTKKQQCLSVLLYFTPKEVLTKYTSLKFNALSTHLLNKQN